MIEEAFVSFEIAKLLKEKGFDILCDYAYNNKAGYFEVDRSNFDEVYCFRPSLAMAMKGLREVHHLYIQVMLDSWACGGHMGYYVVIQATDSDFEEVSPTEQIFYETYEEAAEAGILYCLENLI